MATIEIKLNRPNKVYHEGETVTGAIIVESKTSLAYQSVSLIAEGVAALTLSAKSVGRLESMYNSVKPISLFGHSIELARQGKIPAGTKSFPFEIPLKPHGSIKWLLETYRGVYISVQYNIKCLLKRPLLNKDLTKETEIYIEYKSGDRANNKPIKFNINPNSIKNANSQAEIPRFSVRGRLDSSVCCLTKPMTGELVVEASENPIRSIELQLMRVETVGSPDGFAKEATEIQNIEIGCGDVCRGLSIPIFMIFPRMFACPTVDTPNFKIEFELNIVIVFEDDRMISENFPIKLTRF
uniref:Vacuolar protein sorting-associated protein 26C n=1 Tax=Ciona intestinalis TaxID=7719 RepID=F6TVY6_CIOIN|nr:Down syndrome critical region protein 3 homolog [Ciona intestinalis]|eukprot:XP_002122877.1 Down syndrome critical region protein 3 homolog [Ciona intestinalis]